MPAQPESYSIKTGEVLSGGRFASRPYLVCLGHSMVVHSEISPATTYVGFVGESPHKWLNCILGMPFDYIHSNVDMLETNNLVNGFYGRSGRTSGQILAESQAFVDALSPLAGGRRVVAALMAEINDLTGGVPASTTWANYQSMASICAVSGWKTLYSKAPPSTAINTTTERDNFAAFNALLSGDLPVMDFTAPYLDTSNPNGYQQPLTAYAPDGTHVNQTGAYLLGLSGASALEGIYPRWKPLASDVVCSQNPTLMTAGGTLGANASGVVPAGFTLNANGAGSSVVGSYGPDYYQMVFSYSGASAPWLGTPQGLIANAFTANAVPGTTLVHSLCDVEVVSCTNYQLQSINDYGAGEGEIPPLNDYATTGWMDSLSGKRINLHTEPHTVPAAATQTTTSFGCRPCYRATAASLTVRIRWIGTKQYG